MTPSASSDEEFEIIDHPGVSPDDLPKIQEWLQPTEYEAEGSEFRRHLSSQAPGTGLWITETPRFQQWHDSDEHGSLWIKGVPGAGKSVMTAAIIQHLRDVEKVPVLFFFFRNILTANRDAKCMLRDWLSQLLPHIPQLRAAVAPLCDTRVEDISEEEFWRHLETGLASLSRAYCIVDALDETVPAVADLPLFRRLNSLATFKPSAIKVLMTSRPKQYLQRALRDASIVHISLQQDLVGKDISAFVSYRLRAIVPDPTVQESVTSIVSERSCGLFLYARLLVDQIAQALLSTPDIDLEQLGSTLPIGLEEMYDGILTEKAREMGIEASVQVRLLELVTHASRPMRLNELGEAMRGVFPDLTHEPKAMVRGACGPLLEILEDESVQILHHSFAEFLLGSDQAHVFSRDRVRQFPVLDSREAHRKLAVLSLDYLQSGKFGKRLFRPGGRAPEDPPSSVAGPSLVELYFRSDQYLAVKLKYPFLEYAVRNWAFHANHFDVADEEFFQRLNRLVNAGSRGFRAWVCLQHGWSSSKPSSPPPGKTEPWPSALHIAAFAGLTEYAKSMLVDDVDVDTQDPFYHTALWWAAEGGHLRMTSFLLNKGADPEIPDHRDTRPIHQAAKKNHAEIVQLLLRAGASPTVGAPDQHGPMTAVEYAFERGHLETLLAMIPFVDQDTLEQMLDISCKNVDIARALLDNSTVRVSTAALCAAVKSDSPQTVGLLLERGADATATHDGKTPLHFLNAVMEEHKVDGAVDKCNSSSICKLLLEAGADLEQRDSDGDTPLLSAVEQGYRGLGPVTALLRAGANASVTGSCGYPCLHRLLRTTYDIEVLELALRRGADITARGKRGHTIWHAVLGGSSYGGERNSLHEVIGFLLDNGAGPLCSTPDADGVMALELAARDGCDLESFRLILQACPSKEAWKRCLRTLCEPEDYPKSNLGEWFETLISAGCPLDELDQLLLGHTGAGEPAFELLLKYGARMDAVDHRGRGVLHYCLSVHGAYQRLPEFVGRGLDPLRVDNEGNTLLHEAARSYHRISSNIRVIRDLVGYGVPISTRNHRGQTVLHMHSEADSTASGAGSPDTTRSFLSVLSEFGNGVDIDAQDHEGFTALHLAAMRSEVQTAQLIFAGADWTLLTANGDSALHLACRARQSNVVGFLLEHSSRQHMNGRNSSGRTPLHLACRSGRPESVRYLLKYGADPEIGDARGRTALHSCAEFAIEDKLWFLREHADKETPNIQDRLRPSGEKYRSVHEFLRDYSEPWTVPRVIGVRGIVSMLLSAGACANTLDYDYRTPLAVALELGCNEMIHALRFSVHETQIGMSGAVGSAQIQAVAALIPVPNKGVSGAPEEAREELLAHPKRYFPWLGRRGVEFIRENGQRFLSEGYNRPDAGSLLQLAAGAGSVEIVQALGSLAKALDDPGIVCEYVPMKNNGYGFPKATCWRPALYAACSRGIPNLQMLEADWDRCERPSVGWQVEREGEAHPRQLEAVRYLVDKGAEVDARNENRETPLHVACSGHDAHYRHDTGFRSVACVELLLDLGADIDALDTQGQSPLQQAGSSPDVMKLLLARGASLSIGKTNPLFAAINSSNVDALKVILDAGVSIDTLDEAKYSFRHHTGYNNAKALSVLRALIEHGSDLYALLNGTETLIHCVFEFAQKRTVDVFLEYPDRIDFEQKDQSGRTVLHAACSSGCRPFGEDNPAQESVVRLVGLGVDVGAVDNKGRTALHHIAPSSIRGMWEKEKLNLWLLEQQASHPLVCQKDHRGQTPLHCTLRQFSPAVCEKLLSLGADILEPDPDGITALHHLAKNILAGNKAPVMFEDSDRLKPFDAGILRLWKVYLDAGGEVNVRDAKGNPPLFTYFASAAGKDHIISRNERFYPEIFPVAGVLARNDNGDTVLHVIAAEKEYHYRHRSARPTGCFLNSW